LNCWIQLIKNFKKLQAKQLLYIVIKTENFQFLFVAMPLLGVFLTSKLAFLGLCFLSENLKPVCRVVAQKLIETTF
jgi:hypothetical protein